MDQLVHINKNYQNLVLRSKIIKIIRIFFDKQNFVEMDPPTFLRYPDSEPHLSPIPVNICNEKKEILSGFLHTSPEYTLKKAIASGFKNVFSLSHCFRNYESFGGNHNPEFTMLEWYRSNENFEKIMDDLENLFKFISKKTNITTLNGVTINQKWQRFSIKELFSKYIKVNLDDYLDEEKMFNLCIELGFNLEKQETFEDLFYRIFLNKIEPFLGKEIPTIIYNYPAQMAALAKLSDKDSRYAERFELYINGMELANAFSELTDKEEQEKRIKKDNSFREQHALPTFGLDKNFIEAVGQLPPCAGIALGVDRLTMLFAGCQNIDDVLVLPASKL